MFRLENSKLNSPRTSVGKLKIFFSKVFTVWRCRGLIYTWFSLTDFLWVAPVTSFQLLYSSSFCYISHPAPSLTSPLWSNTEPGLPGIVTTHWDLRGIPYFILRALTSHCWMTNIEDLLLAASHWLVVWLLASLLASGSFNQVQTLRQSWESWRESSGFSRQADRSDNASQKNRDLFAAHSIQTPPTLTFKFCLFISPIRCWVSVPTSQIFSPGRPENFNKENGNQQT